MKHLNSTITNQTYTRKGLLLLSILILGFQQIGFSQGDASSKQIIAVRLTEKITIDGKLSEDSWNRPGFDELYQQEPNQAEQPSQRTEFWIAYDDDAIYYAAQYYDSNPDSILARLVRRDFVWGDPSDGTVLYLDSYGDKRNGYFFYVNAAGTLADGLLMNDSKQTDLSWDAVWEGVPHINEDGWSVEIRIPFSQLRFKKNDIQLWGINVERYFSRKAETDMVAYTPRNENGFASRFPSLTGIKGLKTSTKIELLPYITAKAEYVGHDKNNPFNPGHRYTPSVGLDLRAPIGNSLTLNATINPDFGQVEVDPAEVNLTDVETAFQEKRPFFTEGVSIYRFGNGGTNSVRNYNWPGANIFYSRRIGRVPQGRVPANDYADVPNGTTIFGAAKISGRLKNGWKIGTIHAITQREFASIDNSGIESESEVEPQAYYGVLRLQRDFNEGKQGIGVLTTFTNRFFKDPNLKYQLNKDAIVAGVDGWFFLDNDRTYVITGWLAGSRVSGDKERMTNLQMSSRHYFQRPDVDHINIDENATSLSGYAGRIMLNKNRGKFTINTAIGFLSPKFEINDLGYGSYSDLINMHWAMSYRFNTPTNFYQNLGFNASTYANFDFGGNKIGQGISTGAYINFKNLSGAGLNFNYNPESFNARRTRGGPLTLNPSSRSYNFYYYSDNRKWWVANFGGYLSTGDNATSKGAYANIELKISSRFTLQTGINFRKNDYNAQWVRGVSDPLAMATYGKRYIFANLDQTVLATEIRMDWILKPNLSFQVYLQPYIVSGKYDKFKSLQTPKSYDFLQYGENGSTIIENQTAGNINSYTLDADGGGPSEAITIGNPNFNYISLRGNAVLRWEYRKGSTLYLVWTQSREMVEPNGEFDLGNSFESMFNTKADNIFMLKFTYWI